MNNADNALNPQPTKWRWFTGCVVGIIGNLSLIAFTFMLGPIALVGFMILGQYLLFEQAIYFIYALLPGKTVSYELGFIISFLAYSGVWGLIGALLASRRKKLLIAGCIFLIIYIIAGYISFEYYGSSMIPT